MDSVSESRWERKGCFNSSRFLSRVLPNAWKLQRERLPVLDAGNKFSGEIRTLESFRLEMTSLLQRFVKKMKSEFRAGISIKKNIWKLNPWRERNSFLSESPALIFQEEIFKQKLSKWQHLKNLENDDETKISLLSRPLLCMNPSSTKVTFELFEAMGEFGMGIALGRETESIVDYFFLRQKNEQWLAFARSDHRKIFSLWSVKT